MKTLRIKPLRLVPVALQTLRLKSTAGVDPVVVAVLHTFVHATWPQLMSNRNG